MYFSAEITLRQIDPVHIIISLIGRSSIEKLIKYM